MFVSRRHLTAGGYNSFSFSHLVVLHMKFHPGKKKLCKMISFTTDNLQEQQSHLPLKFLTIVYMIYITVFETEQAFLFLFYPNVYFSWSPSRSLMWALWPWCLIQPRSHFQHLTCATAREERPLPQRNGVMWMTSKPTLMSPLTSLFQV